MSIRPKHRKRRRLDWGTILPVIAAVTFIVAMIKY